MPEGSWLCFTECSGEGLSARGLEHCGVTESRNGRGWQGPLWVTQSNPLPKQGHPEQAAQHRGQTGLEYLQRRRLHSLSGQPGSGLRHPQREEVLPRLQLELPLLQFVPIRWEVKVSFVGPPLSPCTRPPGAGMLGGLLALLVVPATLGRGGPRLLCVGDGFSFRTVELLFVAELLRKTWVWYGRPESSPAPALGAGWASA